MDIGSVSPDNLFEDCSKKQDRFTNETLSSNIKTVKPISDVTIERNSELSGDISGVRDVKGKKGGGQLIFRSLPGVNPIE